MRRAIDSALAQTYPAIEVIVVNDGSNDHGETERIARSYESKIRYFDKANGGVATALNYAISVMHGEYFTWLSHDDEYLPNKVASQIAFIERLHNRLSVVYCGFEIIDEASNKIESVMMPEICSKDFRYSLACNSFLNGCTLLIARDHLDRLGGFNPNLRTTQDYDLWFRMAESTPFIGMSDVLVRSRRHCKQGTNVMSDIVLKECNDLHISFFNQIIKDRSLEQLAPIDRLMKLASIVASFRMRGFMRAYEVTASTIARESFRYNSVDRKRIMGVMTECNSRILQLSDATPRCLRKVLRFLHRAIKQIVRRE